MMSAPSQGSLPIDTRMIAAHTADGYQAALKALVKHAQRFIADENADSLDLSRHARRLSEELHKHDYQPRKRMTRTEVHRNALRQFISAIDEFVDLEHHDGGSLGLRVWEAFEWAVKGAARSADSYGPGDTTWAPEDDSNPLKTSPVPVPDPTAEPVNGIHQGDWVACPHHPDEPPRQVLTGVEDGHFGPSVRLSDTKDGTYYGGYHIQAHMLGTDYVRVDPPGEPAGD
jgi:hypothetical protein